MYVKTVSHSVTVLSRVFECIYKTINAEIKQNVREIDANSLYFFAYARVTRLVYTYTRILIRIIRSGVCSLYRTVLRR